MIVYWLIVEAFFYKHKTTMIPKEWNHNSRLYFIYKNNLSISQKAPSAATIMEPTLIIVSEDLSLNI